MDRFFAFGLFSFYLLNTTLAVGLSQGHSARYANTSRTSGTHAFASPSAGLADYIASGLGLAQGSSFPTASGSGRHSTQSTGGNRLSSGFNGTNSTGQCWIEWNDYWQMSTKLSSMFTTFTTGVDAYDYTYSYSNWAVTTTETEGNGNFPTKTIETTLTTSSQVWWTISNSHSTDTMTITTKVSNTLTTPPCRLPSYVPECQSSWVAWGNSGAQNYLGRPGCTQADVPKSVCEKARSNWLASESGEAGEIDGKIGLTFVPFTANGTTSMSASWPTSSTLAPGCTVGCQSCRVSGSKVKLLYWPPETTTWHNGTFAAMTSKATGIVTAKAYGTTLTSPTVYISFDKLHASNSCSVLGKTLSNVIVGVTNSATMSSLFGWGRYWGLQATASFNFTDLYVTPVPNSIYMSQPRCASSANSIEYSCLRYHGASGPSGCQTSDTPLLCATTLPYEPVIAIPREVQKLQPEWDDCIGGIIGVYDPPQALHEASAIVKPTLPGAGQSTTAKTTQQSEASPDATTSAYPSPTAPNAAPSTQVMTTPEASQHTSTSTLDQDQPAQTQQVSTASTDTGFQEPALEETSSKNALDILTEAQASLGQDFTSTNDDPVESTQAQASPDTISSGVNTLNPTSEGLDTTISSNGQPLFTYDPSSQEGPTFDTTQGSMGPENTAIPPIVSASPAIVFTENEQTASAVQSGSHVIIIDPTKTEVLEPGQSTTIGSQSLAFQSSGVLVVGDSTVNLPTGPGTASSNAPAAVWTNVNGDEFSAVTDRSSVVIAGPASSTTFEVAETAVTFAGQTISVPTSGGPFVVDGSSIPTSVTTPSSSVITLPPFVSWTANSGDVYSAIIHDGEAIITGQGGTATLAAGGSGTILAGQIISVPASATALFVDGSTIAVPQVATGTRDVASAAATWTASDGAVFSAIPAESNSVVLIGPETTAVFASGSGITFAGQTVSIASNGEGLVIDGSTISADSQTATHVDSSLPALVTSRPTGSTTQAIGASNSASLEPEATTSAGDQQATPSAPAPSSTSGAATSSLHTPQILFGFLGLFIPIALRLL